MSESVTQDKIKYEWCIYVIGIVGAISQMGACLVIIAHLVLRLSFDNEEMNSKGVTYSYIGIFILTGSSFSEILLLRAVNQRILRYIQWWMFSTFILLMFSLLLVVIIGFTLLQNGLWITLSFVYLLLRFPVQMYFVDGFTHTEIMHREAHPLQHYTSVLYRRVS